MLGLVELAQAAPTVEQRCVVAEGEREPGLELLDEPLGDGDMAGLRERLEEGEEEGGVIVVGAGGEESVGEGQEARRREAAEDGGEEGCGEEVGGERREEGWGGRGGGAGEGLGEEREGGGERW